MRINFSFLSNRCVFDFFLILVFNRVFKTVSLVFFFFFLQALISRVF